MKRNIATKILRILINFYKIQNILFSGYHDHSTIHSCAVLKLYIHFLDDIPWHTSIRNKHPNYFLKTIN